MAGAGVKEVASGTSGADIGKITVGAVEDITIHLTSVVSEGIPRRAGGTNIGSRVGGALINIAGGDALVVH